MSSPVAGDFLRAIVRIVNPDGASGTGFLVTQSQGGKTNRPFLITNKHVVGDNPQARRSITHLEIHSNVLSNSELLKANRSLAMRDLDGEILWREHPDPDVDVFAIAFGPFMRQNRDLQIKAVPSEWVLTKQGLVEHDITIAEDVLLLGYPLDFRHAEINAPIVRSGLIATAIGHALEDESLDATGMRRHRRLRGFLVDGGALPGQSGSPVVVKPITGYRQHGLNIVSHPRDPHVIGILAETRYAPINGSEQFSYAGLGFAVDAETICETIELFSDMK